MMEIDIRRPHLRRLRAVWQSAGWPCHDMLELELVAAGLLERHWDSAGRETVRVSDPGVQALAASLQLNRNALDAHELLVERVAKALCQAGRLTWRRLSLRSNVNGVWTVCRPDVFSIRSTSVEAYAEPVVYEIKVSRADLLSDLRQQAKGAAYLGTSSQCWYVLKAGIAKADEIPPQYGVMLADDGGIEVARPAPHRLMNMPFATWMALARCGADRFDRPEQAMLCTEQATDLPPSSAMDCLPRTTDASAQVSSTSEFEGTDHCDQTRA
tara:strand:+ start:93 stop:902 length:810 start_codon:yes stop_codon:yes gene_type:complete